MRVIGVTAALAVLVGAIGGATIGSKSLVAVGGVVLVGIVVTVLGREHNVLQRAYSEPLERLTEGARKAERGELDIDSAVGGPTEMAVIGMGLRKVAGQLDETRRVVTQREAQLGTVRGDLKAAVADLESAKQTIRQRDDQLAEYAQDLQAMLTVARDVTDSPNLGALLATIASAALEASALERVVVWLAESQHLAARYDSTAAQPLAPHLELVAFGHGRVGRAAVSRAVVVDAGRANRTGDKKHVAMPPAGAAAGIALPLVAGSHVVGVLEVMGDAAAELATRQSQRLSVLSDHAATAIEAARLETRLELLNRVDALTGLANHRQFAGDLTVEVDRSRRYGAPVSLLMLNLERLVVEQPAGGSGHTSRGTEDADRRDPAEALALLSGALLQGTRATDSPYSLGDGRYVVLARDCDDEEARGFAFRLQGTLAGHFAASKDVETSQMLVSIGAATIGPGSDGDALMAQAERAADRARQGTTGPVVTIGALDDVTDGMVGGLETGLDVGQEFVAGESADGRRSEPAPVGA